MVTTTIFKEMKRGENRFYILIQVDERPPMAIEIKGYEFEHLLNDGVPLEKE